MAVTLDVNGAEGSSGGVQQTSISFAGPNISAGLVNSALCVGIVYGNASSTVAAPSTLTRGSQTLNLIGSTDNTSFAGNQVAWYGLLSPTSGTGNITGTFASNVLWFAAGSSFQGVDQTGGTTTFANYTGNGASGAGGSATLNLSITTANGDYTMIAGAFGQVATTPWTGPSAIVQVFRDPSAAGIEASVAQNASTTTSDAWVGHNTAADVMTLGGFHLKAAAAATKPFAQTDWPVPTPPNREPTLLSWIQAYKLLLYQGQDVLPTRQLEWQVPRSAEPYPYRSWEAKYNPNLIGKDVLPRNQLEWQVPKSPEPYPYRSWEAFYNRNLIGKDKFFDGPGNGPDFDYPLPKSPEPFPYRTWTQNLLQTTLAPTLAKPFAQYDWQVPVGAEPNWRRSWEFWFNYNLIGKDQFPVRQLDWQLPPSGVETYPYRSWEAKYNPNLVGQDVLPVRQLDWQLPTAPPKIDQTWIVNLQLSTLAPVVTTVPFRQFDWPLPQGYAPIVQAGNQSLNLSLQSPFMMIPFQWDIVEGPPFVNPSSSQNLLLTTLAPPPSSGIPFRQLDWRLPDFFLQ